MYYTFFCLNCTVSIENIVIIKKESISLVLLQTYAHVRSSFYILVPVPE